MNEKVLLNYVIDNPLELNLSYMPFIHSGGLFVPTSLNFKLEDEVTVSLKIPYAKERIKIDGKVIWITSKKALHHTLAGIGIQFVGPYALEIRNKIENHLDAPAKKRAYSGGIDKK